MYILQPGGAERAAKQLETDIGTKLRIYIYCPYRILLQTFFICPEHSDSLFLSLQANTIIRLSVDGNRSGVTTDVEGKLNTELKV